MLQKNDVVLLWVRNVGWHTMETERRKKEKHAKNTGHLKCGKETLQYLSVWTTQLYLPYQV